MTRLESAPIASDERHVFAFLILKADLPTIEEFGSGTDVCQIRVLERSLQLATDYILKAVVRDDVMMCTLIFDRDGLLHQATFLEFVAVDERSAKTALLIRGQTLGEVGVDLTRGLWISYRCSIERRVIELVIRSVEVVSGLCDSGSNAFFPLSFGAAGRIQSRLFLFGLKCSH